MLLFFYVSDIELVAYFACCKMQPSHLFLVLRRAMSVAWKAQNFVTTAAVGFHCSRMLCAVSKRSLLGFPGTLCVASGTVASAGTAFVQLQPKTRSVTLCRKIRWAFPGFSRRSSTRHCRGLSLVHLEACPVLPVPTRWSLSFCKFAQLVES